MRLDTLTEVQLAPALGEVDEPPIALTIVLR